MSQTEAQITTIELNRALFRLRHARTLGEKIQLEKTVKWLRSKVDQYKQPSKPIIRTKEKTL